MDQVTIQSLSAQLIENPLYLLEMPESIFELFETADNESRMESDCNSSSAYSSFQCSRCESRSDISQLDDFEQNDFELRLGEYLATSSISDANEDSLPVLEMSSKDSAEIFSAENMDTGNQISGHLSIFSIGNFSLDTNFGFFIRSLGKIFQF